ncbi:hypothetical protein RHSIM_Rhsim12G0096200 [Rhododendron simsii]|uniref:Amidohydrolase-related domain-containing protein n=1 Tax=Rhododendron simsii TaxID=118357 RepID=A0A834G5T4_RHOSS|nr:hypothetical protein RHSIM_Rhsim12G0096200 [Rhododendron simsii]
MVVRFNSVKPLIIAGSLINSQQILLTPFSVNRPVLLSAAQMATTANTSTATTKLIDSHLHVWASPKEAADMYPYFPGQEPTFPGHVDFLLEFFMWYLKPGVVLCQHNGSDSVLKKYPTKFVGCCLANPAEDGIGLKQLEHLILKVCKESSAL